MASFGFLLRMTDKANVVTRSAVRTMLEVFSGTASAPVICTVFVLCM